MKKSKQQTQGEQKIVCYENYPLSTVLISNLFSVLTYSIGFYILLQFGLIYSIVYLLYIVLLEIRLLKKSCVNCYYYGKYCAFGVGKLAPLFKKGNKKLAECEIRWKTLIPDILVSLIPITAGIILLIKNFSWFILVLILLLFILMSFGNGFVRGQLACKYCKQRELGCPAEKLFNKNKSRKETRENQK